MEIKNLAIVGLGQLGCSLLYALNKNKFAKNILVSTQNSELITNIIKKKLAQVASKDLEAVIPQADFIVLCTPINAVKYFITEKSHLLKKGAILTDISSVMGEIIDTASLALKGKKCFFVSSHPMAGTEKVGFKNASPNLYKNTKTFLCPSHNEKANFLVKSFWENLDSEVIEIDKKTHDTFLAYSSHLLHLLSAIITDFNLSPQNYKRESACAGAFKDFSRISSSCPQMWKEVIENNKNNLIESIDSLEKKLTFLKDIIENNNFDLLENYLKKMKNLHQNWIELKNKS